jgi:hypothetical protein
MPGPSTRLILGSDLEYHRRLDGLTPGEENSIVSRRTKIENRQRLSHLAPASHVGEGVMSSRAPWLHGRYPASSLLRAPPPPSRLRPISRWMPVIRPTLLRRFLGGTRTASPVAQRILVTVLPLPPRRSESTRRSGFVDSCCLRSNRESSASEVICIGATYGFTCVAAR